MTTVTNMKKASDWGFESVREQSDRLNRSGWPNSYWGERDDWAVCFGQTRDNENDPLQASNWQCICDALDGVDDEDDCDAYAIESAGHWACGWVETIVVNPQHERAMQVAYDLTAALENYPVLDESDWSEREHEAHCEDWENWAQSDVLRDIVGDLESAGYWAIAAIVDDADCDELTRLFVDCDEYPDGDHWPIEGIANAVRDDFISYALKNRPKRAVTLGAFVRIDPNQMALPGCDDCAGENLRNR